MLRLHSTGFGLVMFFDLSMMYWHASIIDWPGRALIISSVSGGVCAVAGAVSAE